MGMSIPITCSYTRSNFSNENVVRGSVMRLSFNVGFVTRFGRTKVSLWKEDEKKKTTLDLSSTWRGGHAHIYI